MRPAPDTKCPTCWRAEATIWHRLKAEAFPDRPGPFAGLTRVVQAAVTGQYETWYDRHRRDWETSGDHKHLARMLRHVGTL